jgi:hypothetical protein
MGVFLQRSPLGAVPPTWSTPRRVSARGVHAERAAIAADGPNVVVGWVTQQSYLHYSPTDPRVFWIRASTTNGRTWRAPHRVSLPSGRVDYPHLAVEGSTVYAVWTNGDTGEIRFGRSTDLGRTWTRATIGTTSAKRPSMPREGYAGLPDIGASGSNVMVAWFATKTGQQVVATSDVGGADLVGATPTELVATSPYEGQQYPGVGGAVDPADPRVAVAYTTDTGVELRVFDGGALGPALPVWTWPVDVGTMTAVGGYGPAVLPLPVGGIAVAVAACRPKDTGDPCDPLAQGTRIETLTSTSADGGATWGPVSRLTRAGAPYLVSDEPSIALTGSVQRIAYVRYGRTFTEYDVWMRSGS